MAAGSDAAVARKMAMLLIKDQHHAIRHKVRSTQPASKTAEGSPKGTIPISERSAPRRSATGEVSEWAGRAPGVAPRGLPALGGGGGLMIGGVLFMPRVSPPSSALASGPVPRRIPSPADGSH